MCVFLCVCNIQKTILSIKKEHAGSVGVRNYSPQDKVLNEMWTLWMTLHRCERQSTLGSNSVLGHVSIQDADNIFSHSMALLSPGRKKISCRYGASWTGEHRAPGMTEWGRTGVNAACSRGCLVWNRDGRAEDNCVLPEVNIVLSAAQLSSHSRIYFNNCWRKEGGRRRGDEDRER